MILDLFGGPGGWAEGLRALGLTEVGIEFDPWACATRRAAGHPVIRADVSQLPVDHLAGRVEGLIASPPCQAFSAAGNGQGRDLLDLFVGDVDRGDWGCRLVHGRVGAEVLQVGRWAEAIRPRWVACEQVPPVLPIWRAYAHRWRALYGWSTWAGVLNAADYGVPQTRRRAILVARSDGWPALPPDPTHAREPDASLFGELRPWVSMAEALEWVGEDEPARTLAGNRAPRQWAFERPATTIVGDARCWPPGHKVNADDRARLGDEADERYSDRAGTEAIRLTIRDALALQSFRPDYPVQGTKTAQFRQVGDAVPPLLAAHIVAAVTGIELREAAA